MEMFNFKSFQVCKIIEGQRYSKRLNEKQITALLKVTCQRPSDRESDILRVCFSAAVILFFIFNYLLPGAVLFLILLLVVLYVAVYFKCGQNICI